MRAHTHTHTHTPHARTHAHTHARTHTRTQASTHASTHARGSKRRGGGSLDPEQPRAVCARAGALAPVPRARAHVHSRARPGGRPSRFSLLRGRRDRRDRRGECPTPMRASVRGPSVATRPLFTTSRKRADSEKGRLGKGRLGKGPTRTGTTRRRALFRPASPLRSPHTGRVRACVRAGWRACARARLCVCVCAGHGAAHLQVQAADYAVTRRDRVTADHAVTRRDRQ